MHCEFIDTVAASNVRTTADGYLVADAAVARTGIQEYLGSEVGRPDMPIVRVYRPEEEVFSRDSLNSYAHRPMTNNHPDGPVVSKNWRQHSVGQTGGEVVRDGEFVRVSMVLMDQAAIDDYKSGKRELSMGYSAEIEFVDGVTPDGEQFDAIQRSLKMNHLALVDKARGGDRLRIGDRSGPDADNNGPTENQPKGANTMADNLRKVVLDGLTIETTEQGEQAIAKLQGIVSDSAKQLTDAQAVHDAAIAAKDAEMAKKDAEIESLKAKVLSDADIDKRVSERADLVTTAKGLVDHDYSGMGGDAIKAHVVKAKFGDAAVTDKSQAYIDARFDVLVEQGAPADPVRVAMNAKPQAVNDNGYGEYVQNISDAWKGGEA